MGATLDAGPVKRLGTAVEWSSVQASIMQLAPGRRRTAVLIALMSTWREVAYQDGGTTLIATDGQRFVDLVISYAGLPPTVPGFPGMPEKKLGNKRGSEALIARFGEPNPASSPKAGDLMFFDGPSCKAPGSPCCIYLAPGRGESPGICVGLPVAHKRRAAQVLDSGHDPDFRCRFRGYVPIPYE